VGRLEGKVAIVTGAGGGIGRAIVVRFAQEGAQVVAADIDEDRAAETAELAREHGDVAHRRVDVSSPEQVQQLVETAVGRYRRLTTMCNNAAISIPGDVTDVSVEDFDRTIAVNLRGVFLGCKYAIPKMVEQGTGSIINVASFVAILGCSVPQDAYTASKGAVLALTRSLAVQFAPRGVRSNSISPGPIETPLLMDWLVKDEEAKRIRLARNPSGRFGKPEEIVHVAVYLASDESRWTNGANLVIDGGITVNYF